MSLQVELYLAMHFPPEQIKVIKQNKKKDDICVVCKPMLMIAIHFLINLSDELANNGKRKCLD